MMNILVTGTPGSGKTSLVKYAQSVSDDRFIDADELEGLCEWREAKTGKVLGLASDYKGGEDDVWFSKHEWHWRMDFLKKLIKDNPDSIVCGSAENIVDSYKLFDKIYIMKKSEKELLSNLKNPGRSNPFGKTPEQRKGFIKWQNYLIKEAKKYNLIIIEGNKIDSIYNSIKRDLEKTP